MTTLTDEQARKMKHSRVKMLTVDQLRVAHRAGRQAKMNKQFRVTPYYEMPPMDHFWFAGFDGKSWQEAMDSQ